MFSKIYIEITNICNLDCSFCSKNLLSKKEMSVIEFEIAIKKIKNYTDSIYLHVKGEPLIYSRLDEILEICDKNNMKVCITTNGTLLKQKKNILLKHHIKQINVSLHSENNYPNYFENVFNTCDELRKNTTIIYRIWTLKNMNLDKISTNIVEKIIDYYKIDEETIYKIKHDKNIKLNNNLYLDKDYKFDWPILNNVKDDFGTCKGTITHIAILSNGEVVPCCLDSNGVVNLGNIFDNSMDDIINSELFKKINNGFKNQKLVTELCKSCTYRKRFDK